MELEMIKSKSKHGGQKHKNKKTKAKQNPKMSESEFTIKSEEESQQIETNEEKPQSEDVSISESSPALQLEETIQNVEPESSSSEKLSSLNRIVEAGSVSSCSIILEAETASLIENPATLMPAPSESEATRTPVTETSHADENLSTVLTETSDLFESLSSHETDKVESVSSNEVEKVEVVSSNEAEKAEAASSNEAEKVEAASSNEAEKVELVSSNEAEKVEALSENPLQDGTNVNVDRLENSSASEVETLTINHANDAKEDILEGPSKHEIIGGIISKTEVEQTEHPENESRPEPITNFTIDSIKAIEYSPLEDGTKADSNLKLASKEAVKEQSTKEHCNEPTEIHYGFKQHLYEQFDQIPSTSVQAFPRPSAPLMIDSDSDQETLRKMQEKTTFPFQFPLRTVSTEKLLEIKPFVTEYSIRTFPQVAPSKSTNAEEKVPLKVNWNDLTLKFDLDAIDNLDDEALTNIEYYNMILREDLLPPRMPRNVNERHLDKTGLPNKLVDLRTNSDSMKNLYSDASLLNRSGLSPVPYPAYCAQNDPYGQANQNYDYTFYPPEQESYALRERCEHYKREHLGGLLTPPLKERSSKAKVLSSFSLIKDKTKEAFIRAKNVIKVAFTFKSMKKREDGAASSVPSTPPRTLEINAGEFEQGCPKPPSSSSPRKRAFRRKQPTNRRCIRGSPTKCPRSLYTLDENRGGTEEAEVNYAVPGSSNGQKVGVENRTGNKTDGNDWVNNYYQNLSLDSVEEIELFFQSMELEEEEQKRNKKAARCSNN